MKILNQQWSTARRNNLIQIMQQIDFKCFILNYLTLEKEKKMLTEIMAPTEIYTGSSRYLGHRSWVLIDWILTGAVVVA